MLSVIFSGKVDAERFFHLTLSTETGCQTSSGLANRFGPVVGSQTIKAEVVSFVHNSRMCIAARGENF